MRLIVLERSKMVRTGPGSKWTRNHLYSFNLDRSGLWTLLGPSGALTVQIVLAPPTKILCTWYRFQMLLPTRNVITYINTIYSTGMYTS